MSVLDVCRDGEGVMSIAKGYPIPHKNIYFLSSHYYYEITPLTLLVANSLVRSKSEEILINIKQSY